jgi:hypothetical protein
VAIRRRADPVAGVVRHEIEDHPDVTGGRLRDQPVERRKVAELRMHVPVVGDVIPPIPIRGRRGRGEPDPVHAEPLEVVQVVDHALQVADPVAVGVRERADVDLVDDAVPPPRGLVVRHRPSIAAARTSAHYPA